MYGFVYGNILYSVGGRLQHDVGHAPWPPAIDRGVAEKACDWLPKARRKVHCAAIAADNCIALGQARNQGPQVRGGVWQGRAIVSDECNDGCCLPVVPGVLGVVFGTGRPEQQGRSVVHLAKCFDEEGKALGWPALGLAAGADVYTDQGALQA